MSEMNRTEAVDYYNVVIDKETGKVKDFRARHISNPPKDETEEFFAEYYANVIAYINGLPARLEAERKQLSTIFESMLQASAEINDGSTIQAQPVLKLFN